jgi:hypothetical protein
MALTIDQLQIQIQAQSTSAASSIDALANSLGRLKLAAKGGAGLTSVSKQFQAFSQAIQSMTVPAQKIESLVAALKPLETIGKSNLGPALNQLKKIPTITNELDDAKLSSFAAKIQQVTTAVAPLAAEMEKVSAGFSKLPANIQKAINANAKLTRSNRTATKSYSGFGISISAFVAKLTIAYFAVRRISRVISDWIAESNAYVEDLNLFTVAMGDYTKEAKAYAEAVSEAYGIDSREWMRYQAVFMNMAKGFGIAADRAYLMSKNLTQLGYDLASVFNVSFNTAMEKLESAISGQPRPMREWGFDLSEATLKAVALRKGIDENVESMTQMEKAQLRYVQLLETAQKLNLTGDLARTLKAPSNQLRILSAAATQAARALGNIFIPALNKVLPYAIAFLKIIRWVAQELANLFGFTLPEIDYSGLGNVTMGAEDAEEALEGASGAAKELQKQLAPFDELNILSEQNAGGGAGAGIGGGGLELDLPEYDFFDNAINSNVQKIFGEWKKKLTPFVEWLKDNFKTLLGLVKDIGLAILAWKLTKSFINGIARMLELTKAFPKLSKGLKIATGLILTIVGVKWAYEAGFKIGYGNAEFLDIVKAILGPIAAGIGGALIGSALFPGIGTAVGFAIGFTVAAIAEVIGIIKGKQAKAEDEEAARVAEWLKEQATMTVTDAVGLFQQWYDVWAPDHQVLVELIKTKENTADELKTTYGELQKVFDVITSDGVVAKEELEEITQAMTRYFDALNADQSANSEIVRQALVGALGRASEEGVGYIQNLIDKYNEWTTLKQGELGKLQQELFDALKELGNAAPGTEAYTTALNNYNDALAKLSAYTDAEHSAKLQYYTEAIDELKTAISSGTLDLSQVEDAQTQLETLAEKMQTVLDEIESTRESVMISVQTEINQAIALGDTTNVSLLGDVKSALEKDFEAQKESVIGAANGIGASIAEAIANQMLNLYEVTDTDQIQNLVDTQYTPILEAWSEAAKGVITNSETLKGFPQLVLDTMMSSAVSTQPDLDDEGFAIIETWAEKVLGAVKDGVDNALKSTGLKDQSQALIDGLTNGMADATVSTSDMETSVNNIVSQFETAAGIRSPATIMIPVGEEMIAGAEKGMTEYSYELSTYTDIVNDLIGQFDTVLKQNSMIENIRALGKNFITMINEGIANNTAIVESTFSTLLNALITKFEAFSNRCRTAMNNLMRDFSNTMGSVSVSSTGKVTYTAMPSVRIERFAYGGFPEPGQMFIARESGPEMVGTIGSRTAVANNDQIVEAIQQGVYEAVMAASSNGGGDIHISIDGKPVEATVTRRQYSNNRMYGRALQGA